MLHASFYKKKVPLGTNECSINPEIMEQLVKCIVPLTPRAREAVKRHTERL